MGLGLVGDSASKMPCGKSVDIAGNLSAPKELVWPQSLLVPGYPGAGDANDRCINKNHLYRLSQWSSSSALNSIISG